MRDQPMLIKAGGPWVHGVADTGNLPLTIEFLRGNNAAP